MDLNFEQLVQRYQAKQKQQEDLAFKAKYVVTLITNRIKLDTQLPFDAKVCLDNRQQTAVLSLKLKENCKL